MGHGPLTVQYVRARGAGSGTGTLVYRDIIINDTIDFDICTLGVTRIIRSRHFSVQCKPRKIELPRK